MNTHCEDLVAADMLHQVGKCHEVYQQHRLDPRGRSPESVPMHAMIYSIQYVCRRWLACFMRALTDLRSRFNEFTSCPFVVLQGTEDEIVDPAGAQMFYDDAACLKKQLKVCRRSVSSCGGFAVVLAFSPDGVVLPSATLPRGRRTDAVDGL